MPYPHVIQFETLDRGKRRAVGTTDVLRRAAVALAHARPGVPRLRGLDASGQVCTQAFGPDRS